MLSFITISALSLLLSRVAAQGGSPSSIVGFEPLTDVRDQARIDLDQKDINDLLDGGDFENAKAMYEKGSHSKSVSNLTVSDGLPVNITQGANITGANDAGKSVRLFAQGSNYTAGATAINVQYKDEGCYVGASTEPETTGCLASSGNLTLDDGTSFGYTYDPASTFNVYSIKLFTQPKEYVFAEGEPFTTDFQKFVDFYGSESYADDIIQAAIAGTSTDFSTGKNVDASQFDEAGRSAIAKSATAYMAIWMYVIRELEHAIYLCETGDCAEESCLGKGAVHEVDEAVAFYAGSLAPDGVLVYNLANDMASEFGTATDKVAQVNAGLLEAFDSAKESIVDADCAGLRTHTTKIVQLMSIPLVQGTMKYTAESLSAPTSETRAEGKAAEAERVIFAASVLPFVANCSSEDADVIFEHTAAGASATDIDAVKTAFANNYECMGISADDVGEYTVTDGGSAPTPTPTPTTVTDGGSAPTPTPTPTSGAAQAGWNLGVILLFYGMF